MAVRALTTPAETQIENWQHDERRRLSAGIVSHFPQAIHLKTNSATRLPDLEGLQSCADADTNFLKA